ncbi:RNA ligase-domain-containing protein [Blyttiomyces helicus]|uniref:RNA ligase-domain-containing protein n=1 Tax=Blyttiomyces helicus TaxID=388810 RepID=A0A4P9WCA2_9FUNG|nr:RNA ligase-domain-containing protein [Blyttiomyces helicus]|eukprot:RKO90281.1 RNA ligase-domain-containing protein [Blyttiomyces helicus]
MALETVLHITVKKYEAYGLRKLNYSQTPSPKNHQVVADCRGLLLDATNARIVSCTFRRFYNYRESGAPADFDFGNATIFEKCDGSLVQIYFCGATGSWEVGTRRTAFGEQGAPEGSTSRQSVLTAMKVPSDTEFEAIANRELDRGVTYAAEYCGPSNLISTVYAEDQVVLLAAMYNNEDRELPSLEQVCAALQASGFNVCLPKTYPLASIADCHAALNELLMPTDEGFVLRDNQTGHRLKLKSPRYLEMKRILTFSRMVKLVHGNEQDEFLATFEDA